MRIRLGIVGTGIAARELHWPALQGLQDRFEVVALANRTRPKAESFAELIGCRPRITSDYRELLSWPEVQAVDLALPIALNASVTVEALRAGKHAIVEKPIAAGVDAARAVVQEAARHPALVLLVAENVRYEPRYRVARQLLEEGKIGRPIMIHHDVLEPLSPESPYAQSAWRKEPEHIGGYLSDGGVHQTAALQLLAGPVAAVQGLVTTFDPDRDPTDTLLANLRFASGVVGHLTYSVGVRRAEPSPLRVHGTGGSVAVHGHGIIVSTPAGEEMVPVAASPTGFDLEFADFFAAIREGRQPEVSPEDTLADLAVIDAVLRSAREGRVIHLA